jgi:hypothetical protein
MLARVGIELEPAACRVSNLLGLEQKVHCGSEFLPALGRRAREGAKELSRWVDESLRAYGKDGKDLVRPGVAAWLERATLPDDAAARVRAAFDLSR